MTNRGLQRDEAAISIAQKNGLLMEIQFFDCRCNSVGDSLESPSDEVGFSKARKVQGNHLVLFGKCHENPIPTAAVSEQ